MVAPVAEFNTYDILKQRYLVLTREALATLKDRVKRQAQSVGRFCGNSRRARPGGAAHGELIDGYPAATPTVSHGPGPCSSHTR